MKTPQIDRFEWDFTSLVDTEVNQCLSYELLRERCKQDPSTLAWIQGVDRGLKEVDYNEFEYCTKNGIEVHLIRDVYYLPHLPETPYLKLPLQLRKSQLESQPKTLRPGCVPLGEQPALQHFESRNRSRTEPEYTVAAFEVYWHLKNEELLRQFEEWLKDSRPEGQPGHPLPPDIKTARANLRCLGALRLLRIMEAAEAQAYTEDIAGKPLYSGTKWSAAKAKAVKLISDPPWIW